jgi:hypothetical protein
MDLAGDTPGGVLGFLAACRVGLPVMLAGGPRIT